MRNVIYLITCKGCNKQYVGQTNQNVSCRMNKHRFDIRKCAVNPVSHVAIHFGSPENKCFTFLPTEIIVMVRVNLMLQNDDVNDYFSNTFAHPDC
jgi:hypothetical protein